MTKESLSLLGLFSVFTAIFGSGPGGSKVRMMCFSADTVPRIRMSHRNPGKSWICNLENMSWKILGNYLYAQVIKFLSQVLANTYGAGLISYRGIYTYIQGDWSPLPLISYGMVLEIPGKIMEF